MSGAAFVCVECGAEAEAGAATRLEAQGYFRDEVRRSLIPVFWPSVVVNLPAELMVYLGVKPGTLAMKIAKVITGLAAFAASIATIWLVFT